MFGFLTLGKERLSPAITDVYMCHLCGLCDTLSKKYGPFARFFTNYDTTLLYLLCTAQSREPLSHKKIPCPIKFRKTDVISAPVLAEFVASISNLLVYEKMIDDHYDEQKKYHPIIRNFITNRYIKAKERLNQLGFPVDLISELTKKQREIEKETNLSILELSQPTALMMGQIFKFTAKLCKAKNNEVGLKKMGNALGKLIYILDSIIDYWKDINLKRFNAISACCHNIESITHLTEVASFIKEELEDIAFNCLQEIKDALNHIDIYHHKGLLENVLGFSLTNKVSQIFSFQDEDRLLVADKSPILQVAGFIPCFPQVSAYNSSDLCGGLCGPLAVGGIILVALYFIVGKGCLGMRGCGCCGSNTITGEDRYGRRTTYKKDPWTGKYKEEGGCC